MIIVDCKWDKANLGENVCEVSVPVDEVFDETELDNLDNVFSYQVVKVATGNVSYMLKLQQMGFSLIETQINWTTRIIDFNRSHQLIERFSSAITFEDISTNEDLDDLLSHIDYNMFSTDRISLDPQYGPAVGRRRYCNWIRNEFENSSAYIAFILLDGMKIGFFMLNVKEKRAYGSLAGIFKKYQDMGFGILTSSSMPLYILDRKLDVKVYDTSTSSNNTSNTKIYSMLGFQIKSMNYVFIKHHTSNKNRIYDTL